MRAPQVGSAIAAGFVFSDDVDGGRPWKPNRSSKTFIDNRRQATIPHFRLHDLRQFMATEMLAHGVPVPTVSQRLGHARVSTTLNVDAHRIPGADRQAADSIADLIDHTCAMLGHRPQRSDIAIANVGLPALSG